MLFRESHCSLSQEGCIFALALHQYASFMVYCGMEIYWCYTAHTCLYTVLGSTILI